jgi:hypothetical protein
VLDDINPIDKLGGVNRFGALARWAGAQYAELVRAASGRDI